MPRGRPAKDGGVYHDFEAARDLTTAPHLSYTLNDSGDHVTCTAHDFVPPPAKRRRIGDLEGSHAQWTPVPRDTADDTEFEYPPWTSNWAASGDGPASLDTGVDPMRVWYDHWPQKYMDEMLWGDGLRGHLDSPSCVTCNRKYIARPPADGDEVQPTPAGHTHQLLCCWTCGDFTECTECCVKRHESMPLHTIESWTGSFWETVSLTSLGLVYQLGHGGRPCIYPEGRVRTMVVIDHRIHTVAYRYCGCCLVDPPDHVTQLLRNRWFPATTIDPETCATFEILDFFRLGAVHANINAHNFVKVIEKQTDALRLTWVADREKALWRMAQQYALMLRVKRSGQGHSPGGVVATQPAQLAVRCWACPRDGYNMPDGWEEMDEKDKYRFQTVLAMDANFRLKNRIRKNERADCALGDGKGYFVETAPYAEHIAGYISSCIAFRALAEKDTKLSTGLRVSGVGGVICARHEVLQPHGLADLQKGERYCNMDYILASVLKATQPPSRVVVSYDIGCQYTVNYDSRMEKMPAPLKDAATDVDIAFGLPVWHGAIHEEHCRSRFSLKYLAGLGRADGEGIERIWSLLNGFAWATKEMSAGARHSWIEEKVDSINFGKNIGSVFTLLRRLVIALDERQVQVKAFERLDKNVDDSDRHTWKKAVRAWERNPDGPSPYMMPQLAHMSEADVRRQLDAEEMEAVNSGNTPVHGISQTAFLVAGLQLESAQRRILADLKGPAVIPMGLEGIINNRRRAFLVKLDKYLELQKVYMPGLASYLEEHHTAEPRAVDAEHISLHLPSSLPSNKRRMVCAEGLPAKELKLRTAQALDTIDTLRKKLHAKQYSIEYRNSHVTGQRLSTRARSLIASIQEKLELDADAYRTAREAILGLSNVAESDDFPLLRDRDLQLEGEITESDAAAMAASSRAGSSQRPRHIHVSTGTHQISWLWTAKGASQEDASAVKVNTEEARQMIGCLWAKARARKQRWAEEVEILREDMRRCLRSLEKQSKIWHDHAESARGRTSAHDSGLRAYALRQEQQWRRMRDKFLDEWGKPYGRTKRLVFERATSLMDDQAQYLTESRALLDLDDDDPRPRSDSSGTRQASGPTQDGVAAASTSSGARRAGLRSRGPSA
ncbi:hypothetical protein K523DRAFT_255071 [Schizophyllum commune Tattone D]|nr:hypothetical protein K523DRAFT_255071 [Schizophyllum commune Tattone D]